MMNSKFLLVVVLFLAPAVYGCLVFEAHLGGPCEAKILYSAAIDNGIQMCTVKGMPSCDSTYDYACANPKYSAEFDTSTGILKYDTDHGNFTIPTAFVNEAWVACEFGCSEAECWVQTSEVTGCRAPAPYKPW